MKYFPVLRARQYEVLALREIADLISESSVAPVIEPITSDYLAHNLPHFVEAGMEFCLIVNPRLPRQNPLSQDTVFEEIVQGTLDEFEGFRPTLYVNGQTQSDEIQDFISRYSALDLDRAYFLTSDPISETADAIVADEPVYVLCRSPKLSLATRNRFDASARVIIEDPFNYQDRNADYPPSESFSDRHTGTADGYAHFGDYSIVGDRFKQTGGLPFAVAIHYMTARLDSDHPLELHHYISDQHETRGNVEEKFLEALEKLIAEIPGLGDLNRTEVTAQFEELHHDEHSPGLPTLKKLGIQHHIELIASLL